MNPMTSRSRSNNGFRRKNNTNYGGRNNNSNNNSGNRRFSGPRNNNSRRFGQRNKQNTEKIDINRFINKAQTLETKEEYKPINKIEDLKINPKIITNIKAKGFINLTPIQDQSINHILEGKDLIGMANTGTGKTGAFLIPMINKVLKDYTQKVLIIIPTRELALQIKDEFNTFAANTGIEAVVCIGGSDMRRNIANLKKRHNFVIGTPGRLKDLENRNVLRINTFNNIILDEVDRMLDMGFVDEMRFLVGKMNSNRQSLFFSATMNDKVLSVAESFLKDPIKISVKTQDTSANIDQDIIKIDNPENKTDVLHNLLMQEEFSKVLIFNRTKRGVDKLQEHLERKGHSVDSIHGDKSQAKRQKALDSFKKNRSKILIATDIAARGLDIPNVSHVINYDIPGTYEDYVHRIGRTGRGDNKGKALTFVEKSLIRDKTY